MDEKDYKKVDKLLTDAIDELTKVRDELRTKYEQEDNVERVELVPLTIEEVRTRLAELSREGHTAEVRKLLAKFGAGKLSEVDPKDYIALMDGALELENGRK